MNKKTEIVASYCDTGSPAIATEMVDNLFKDYMKLMEQSKTKWNEEPILSEKYIIEHEKATVCMFCEENFNDEKIKVRHHAWDIEVEYEKINGIDIVKKSNYLGASCQGCNLKISLKRATLPVFTHNGSKYDHKFIIKGINAKKYDSPFIIAKDGEKMIQIQVSKLDKINGTRYKMVFRDSFNFLNASLDKLSKSLHDSGKKMTNLENSLSSMGYSDKVISMCYRKGVFPYEYIDNISRLNETKLPDRDKFYSSLSGQHASLDDYNFALNLFKEAKCKTIKDYMQLYLKVDVLLLAEVFENFRDVIFDNYGLDPAQFLTTPSLAMQAALLK